MKYSETCVMKSARSLYLFTITKEATRCADPAGHNIIVVDDHMLLRLIQFLPLPL